jgi:hypothetical protein
MLKPLIAREITGAIHRNGGIEATFTRNVQSVA